MIHPEPKFFKHLLLAFCLAFTAYSHSQYNFTDPDFISDDEGISANEGVIGNVHSIAVQADGSLLVGGGIYRCNNIQNPGLVRFSPDGTFDENFDIGIDPNTSYGVNKVIALPDGKILVAGTFMIGDYQNLVRVNSDGSLDETFTNNGFASAEYIRDMKLMSDGRILICGAFTYISGQPREGNAILSANGDLDLTYVPANDAGIVINTVCPQPDGKVLFGINSNGFGTVQRLNADGSVDAGFDLSGTATGSGSSIYDVQLQPDGKILASGSILTGNYQINGVVRLNTDGTRDLSFTSQAASMFSSRTIRTLLQLGDGTFLIGGRGNSWATLVHIMADGTHDFTYDNDADIDYVESNNSQVYALCKVGNNIAVGGLFLYSDLSHRNNLMQIDSAGKIIPEFCALPGPNGTVFQITPHNDKIFVSGHFNVFNGHVKPGIARLNQDGSVDEAFHYAEGADYGYIPHFAVQSDGKVLIPWAVEIRRLNADGLLDQGYSGASYNGTVVKIVSDELDRAYAVLQNSVLRYGTDGTPDNSFSLSVSGGLISDFKITPDGKFFVAGTFTSVNGSAAEYVVKLNNDGTVDNSFNLDNSVTINSSMSNLVEIHLQDTNLIINAFFQGAVSSSDQTIRVFPNGDLDATFQFPTFGIYATRALGVQPDGNIITQVYDQNSYQIYRCLKNGARDYSFPIREYAYSNVGLEALVVSDEAFYLWADYFSYAGEPKNRMIRVKNCPGPVYTEHASTYDSYTWSNGITYTETIEGVVQTFAVSGGCDSTVILDLIVFDPEIQVFTLPSSVDDCTGTAYLSMNGASPYLFDIGSGYVPGNHEAVFTDLCPGIYNASVMDNNGNIFTTTFVIASDSSYMSTDPFEDTDPVLDSISFTIETCDVDLETITEIYIDTFEMLSTNEVEILWAIVDAYDTTFVTAVYNFSEGEGNYYIQLHIYCPEKALSRFFVGTLGVHFNGNGISNLGVKALTELSMSLFPNPASDKITIRFEGNQADLIIRDINGKELLSKAVSSNEQVDISAFATGVYLFEISTEKGASVKRVVKN